MKFGGSSVGTASSILSVKKIVEAVDEPVIVSYRPWAALLISCSMPRGWQRQATLRTRTNSRK